VLAKSRSSFLREIILSQIALQLTVRLLSVGRARAVRVTHLLYTTRLFS